MVVFGELEHTEERLITELQLSSDKSAWVLAQECIKLESFRVIVGVAVCIASI